MAMRQGQKVKFEIAKSEWEELSIENQIKMQDLMSEYFGVDIQGLLEGEDDIVRDPFFLDDHEDDCSCCPCCGCTCDDGEDFSYLYPDDEDENEEE